MLASVTRFSPGDPHSSTSARSGASRPAHQSALEAAGILAVVLGFFVLSSMLDLSERFAHWAVGNERFQLDELPLTLLVLAVCLALFARRRVVELSAEVNARLQAETRAEQALANNRVLAQQLITLQEQERHRLARELHDEIGQCCIGLQVNAATIAADTANTLPDAHASAQAIAQTAQDLQRTVRGMLEHLRPVALDDLGLTDALQSLTTRWSTTHRIPCTLSCSGPLANLGEAHNITLYRVAQEGLTNVARHAQARAVHMHVRASEGPAPRWVELSLVDDGCGFRQTNPTQSGMGLAGMRERVHALQGTLTLAALAPQGTRLHISLPFLPSSGNTRHLTLLKRNHHDSDFAGRRPCGGSVGLSAVFAAPPRPERGGRSWRCQ